MSNRHFTASYTPPYYDSLSLDRFYIRTFPKERHSATVTLELTLISICQGGRLLSFITELPATHPTSAAVSLNFAITALTSQNADLSNTMYFIVIFVLFLLWRELALFEIASMRWFYRVSIISVLSLSRTLIMYKFSMTRKYHNHTLQTNPWHREAEPQNIYSNSHL